MDVGTLKTAAGQLVVIDARLLRQINTEKGGRLKTGVNAGTLTELLTPLPSMADQPALADRIDVVDQEIAAEEARRDALTILFDSLLSDLMTARLRLTDPIPEVS
jgi:type I restriction enzyme, S subunit